MSEVVVLGAGIIGLSIAAELAQRGVDVTVLDRGAVAAKTSWAAGGMLAPYTEEIPEGPLRAYAVASLSLYPNYVAELYESSGIDVQLRLNGVIDLAFDAERCAHLRRRVKKLQASGCSIEYLERADIFAQEGAIAQGVYGGVICYNEGQVENRRLGRALAATAQRRGVRICPQTAMMQVECNTRRVLGVRTPDGFLPASILVNALGPWAGAVPGISAEHQIPVHPVKGQILALAMPHDFLTKVIWGNGVYMIPRRDGRLVVGATVEEAGFDSRITAGGIQKLLNGVIATIPGAAGFALVETWSGHRPASPGEALFLGPTALAGYYVASGHYRNGILLAPITAKILADAICHDIAGPVAEQTGLSA